MAFLRNEEDDYLPVILGQHEIAVQTTTSHFEDYSLLSTIRQEIIILKSIEDEKLVLKVSRTSLHLLAKDVQTNFCHALFIDPDNT